MLRRHFLANAAALPLAFNALPRDLGSLRALTALGSDPEDRVLVLLQLAGGNDGLNTLIPLDQYDTLKNLRPNILLPADKLVGIGGDRALHPSFAPMAELYDAGELAIVQDVSYPEQNRSHFRSQDIWHTGSAADEVLGTGWLGRTLERDHPEFPTGYPGPGREDPLAVSVGRVVSETCQGTVANFSLTVENPFRTTAILEPGGGASTDSKRGRELDFLRTSIAQANQYGATVKARAEAGNTLAEYPEQNPVANALRYIAQMISGGMKTKVYIVTLGGWDTHGAQVDANDATLGRQPGHMRLVAEAVSAFVADLKLLGIRERVIGMTYSDFGRRIRENGSMGTDHGTAAPLFLFGDCVRPGVLGNNPVIDPGVDEFEGVPMQYDYRDVYGSILEDWFGVPEDEVRNILHEDYVKLPILRDCDLPDTSSTLEAAFAKTEIAAAPSPFSEHTQLRFTTARRGRVRVSVYDGQGRLVETLFERRLPAGEQVVNVNTSAYPAGPVVFHLQEGDAVRVVRAVKM